MKNRLLCLFCVGLGLALAKLVHAQDPALTPALSRTITNPNPHTLDYFGFALAAVGHDKVLVGARKEDISGFAQTGVAYLFDTNGALLTTITNPTPENLDYFGFAVAGVGADKVLIGDIQDDVTGNDAGAAYLFSTNGTLVTTFLNPASVDGEHFGFAVAAFGADRVLIGTLPFGAGAAYLFSTNGTLLKAFANPASTVFDDFGSDVAAVGTDMVLIGALRDDLGATDAGVAYLFSTNGTLITTFTNPTPAVDDRFGGALAAVGTDKVLITAVSDNTGAPDAGAAYLFSTNGALLITFTNPAPVTGDSFGHAVTAVGADKLLIAALFNDTGASNAGAAYLFSTNGNLLATLINPTPEADDRFGNAVAAVGTNYVVVGANLEDTGARDAGAAYLFILSRADAPRLNIKQLPNGNVRLFWPLSAADYVLDSTSTLAAPPATNSWSQIPFPYQTNATDISVNVTPEGNQFFRLRKL